MRKTALTVACLAVGILMMTDTVSADTIFDADPTNTTLANNGIGVQGTLTGTPGNLNLQNNGSNFNFTGFFSTDDINTLNGTPIVDTDTVSVTIAVSGLSVGQLRSSGIDFGLQSGLGSLTGISILEAGDIIVRAEASNVGGDIGTFFDGGGFADSGAGGTTGNIADGFTITLDADVSGYTFTLESIGGSGDVVISDTFTGTQFVDFVGNGFFYYAQQQFNTANNGVNLLANITEASIHVTSVAIPEPGSLALIGIATLGLGVRRRR